MSTELQKLAQSENYALFQLRSMRGNLIHINFAHNDMILQKELHSLRVSLSFLDAYIRSNQQDRIRARKKEKQK